MILSNSIRIGRRTAIFLLLALGVAAPALADKPLNSVAMTVGDLGNPFFIQIQHGVESQARKYNPKVKVLSLSSNYDVNNQTATTS